MNIRLIVAYDGTRYLGWSKNNTGLSIEGELEKAIEQILGEKVSLQAASRTDRGVHARGQVVNFFTKQTLPDPAKLKKGINSVLPDDISVLQLNAAPDSFHPTLDAHFKEYSYEICNSPVQSPFYRTFSWHYPYPLDIALMKEASIHLTGTRDFAALGNERQSGKRSVFQIDITRIEEKRVKIVVRGNCFLYKMVRNIAGTLVYTGCGKIAKEALPAILDGGDRTKAGICAPAHGLYLNNVFYEPFQK